MEPYIFYLATSGVFLSTLAIVFTYLNDRYSKFYQLLEQKLSEDMVIMDGLSHLSHEIDKIQQASLPRSNEAPCDYLKRMGWNESYTIHKKRRPYKHWKTKKSEEKKNGIKKEKTFRGSNRSEKIRA